MFPKRFFANVFYALRYFANRGATAAPTYSGVPTVCPPVTPDWYLALVTSDWSLKSQGWDMLDVVDHFEA